LSILIVDRFAYLVFRASDGVLDLAFGVLSLAFGFELGIAGQLPASFLYLPFCLFHATFNAIFIHRGSFLAGLVMSFQTNGQARAFVPTFAAPSRRIVNTKSCALDRPAREHVRGN